MTDDLTFPDFLPASARRDIREFARDLPDPDPEQLGLHGRVVKLHGGGSFTGRQTGENIGIRYTPESRQDFDGTFATTMTAITGVNTFYEGDDLQAAVDALERAAEHGLNDPEDFS